MLAQQLDELLNQYLPHLHVDQISRLKHYLLMLKKWNNVYNLTSITTAKAMVLRHILDSLSISPLIQGDKILDVGTGAGLPGIPLAIANPDKQFYLLDSNQKKIRFLQQVKLELELSNVTVVNARVEGYQPEICFETIMARAFSSLNEFLVQTKHLLCSSGVFLAMKGVYPLSELETISKDFKVKGVEPLHVVDLNAERHVVIAERT